MTELFQSVVGDAVFSSDGKYRYLLTRSWDESLPVLCFLMLNPSIANSDRLDPTCSRCFRRAQDGGFGKLVIVNLFSLVSTDPEALRRVDDPVGPENDRYIMEAAREAKQVIVAWGGHWKARTRSKTVLSMLRDAGVELWALAKNNDGSPTHPLYIANNAKSFRWDLETVP